MAPIVGAVETGGDVAMSGKERHADARGITHAPVAPLWGEDQMREAVPLAGDGEREMPDARRGVARSSDGTAEVDSRGHRAGVRPRKAQRTAHNSALLASAAFFTFSQLLQEPDL
jgi:hypothetical protein